METWIWIWGEEGGEVKMTMRFPISGTGCMGREEEEELAFQGEMLSVVLDLLS